MKKWMIGIFWGILLLPNVLWIPAFKVIENKNMENRILASFPVFSWDKLEDYPEKLEEYINDNAAFRSQFLSLNSGINLLLFRSVDNPHVIRGKDGWFFYSGGRSLQDYRGEGLFTDEELEDIGEKVERVRQYYEEKGVVFLLFLAPNKEQVYPEYLPNGYLRRSPVSRYDQLEWYLREKTGVRLIAPKLYFLENRDWQWYYKTDSHWNEIGSFAGAQMVIEELGGQRVSLEEVEVSRIDRESGDLLDLCYLSGKFAKDDFFGISGYYDNVETERFDLYDNERAVLSVASDAPDKRRVSLCRDSFGVSMANYLSRYFQYVDSYHYEVFQQEFLENNPPDVLVYEVVEREMDRIPAAIEALLPQK